MPIGFAKKSSSKGAGDPQPTTQAIIGKGRNNPFVCSPETTGVREGAVKISR